MTAVFMDLDDEHNPMNGIMLATGEDVRWCLAQLHGRRPFMFQLQLEDGRKLDVGLAGNVACVQRTPSDDLPPYQIATTWSKPPSGQGDTEFYVGGTLTPIDHRYCLSLHLVERILKAHLEGQQLPTGIFWEDT